MVKLIKENWLIMIAVLVAAIVIYFLYFDRTDDSRDTPPTSNEVHLNNKVDSLTKLNKRILAGVTKEKDTIEIIKYKYKTIYKDGKKDFDNVALYTDIQRDSILQNWKPWDNWGYFKDSASYGINDTTKRELDKSGNWI